VIFSSVVRGGSAKGMDGELVEPGSGLVRIIWHRNRRRPGHIGICAVLKLFNWEQSMPIAEHAIVRFSNAKMGILFQ